MAGVPRTGVPPLRVAYQGCATTQPPASGSINPAAGDMGDREDTTMIGGWLRRLTGRPDTTTARLVVVPVQRWTANVHVDVDCDESDNESDEDIPL